MIYSQEEGLRIFPRCVLFDTFKTNIFVAHVTFALTHLGTEQPTILQIMQSEVHIMAIYWLYR